MNSCRHSLKQGLEGHHKWDLKSLQINEFLQAFIQKKAFTDIRSEPKGPKNNEFLPAFIKTKPLRTSQANLEGPKN